ncbi:MAG TPA: CBS domain-containing protein [Candidatus Acidoferrum sp.]|nr:CBS domain-containing protein [Candidatus Acidoferrum sp.]
MITNATVGNLLHHKGPTVWTISANATVFEAIQLLAQKNIGALPVMEGGRLIGIFSERDYTRKIALEGKSSRATPVREIISSPVLSVTSHQTIEEAMRLMTEKHIRHLPVIDEGNMVGFVSIGDMVNWIISAQSAAIDQMESYLAGR